MWSYGIHDLPGGHDRLDHSGRAIDDALTRENLRRHLRQLVLDQAKGGNRLSELLALRSILRGHAQGVLGGAHRAGSQPEAAEVEDVKRDIGAFAHFPQNVFHWHLHLLQNDAARGGGFDPQLVFLPARGEAGKSAFDQKSRDVLAVHFGEDGEQVRPTGVGDPHLGAVEHVMFSVRRKRGLGAHAERVGAGAGLAQGVGCHPLAGREFGQVLSLLRFRAEINQRLRADAGVGAHGHAESAQARELFRHADAADLAQAQAAISLRHFHAEQAQFARLAKDLLRPTLLLMLQRLEVGEHLFFHELFRRLRH